MMNGIDMKSIVKTPLFNHPSIPSGRKTSRIRGAIRDYIRAILAKKRHVRCEDLQAVLGVERARTNLVQMHREGILVVIKKGTRGHNHKTSVYAKA